MKAAWPEIITGPCADDLHEMCYLHIAGNPCICECHKESRAMAEPKKPADHKAKVEKPKVTKTDDGWDISHKGAAFTVVKDVFDDFELMDDLGEVEGGNGVKLPSLLRRLAGAQGFRAIMEALRDKKSGRVSLEAGAEYVGEILNAINPNS